MALNTLTKSLSNSLQVALRKELILQDRPDASLCIISAFGQLTFKCLTPGLRAAFTTLKEGKATVDELSESVLTADGGEALTRFYHHFDQLLKRGWLQHTVVASGVAIATIVSISPSYRFHWRDLDLDRPYQLSRFAYCRREDEHLVLESPVGHTQIILHDWRATALIALLAQPQSIRQLRGYLAGINDEVVAGCLQLLLNAEALTTVFADGSDSEDSNLTLAQWDFHDLVFHSRSRYGRHANLFGANFRHINRIQPLPAVKPSPEGPKIDLYQPELAQLQANDPPLGYVMETRRSVYTYDTKPITLQQLGEFLYRVARVRTLSEISVQAANGYGKEVMQVSSRPYPAGGKCYDLEFYLTINQCEGLLSGLYHYEPLQHQLTRLRERDRFVESLLNYAIIAARQSNPQVLITLAARFQRISWKYDAIAYATTLKHVGVVYQTMYLVATAMNLAPCALGSGDSDMFAAAAKTDYFAETSVGEFILGSLPKPHQS